MYIVQGCGTTAIGCDRTIYIEHGFCAFILNFNYVFEGLDFRILHCQ